MVYEQVEYKGVAYDITSLGLVSETYRRQNAKHDKWILDEEPAESMVALCDEQNN